MHASHWTRRRVLKAIAASFVGGQPLVAQDPSRVETSGKRFITPVTQRAIDRGLEWLANRQHQDGSFGSGSGYLRNVAITSLCGMSFMSAGYTPARGRYGSVVSRAIDFILESSGPNGFINVPESESHGPMYGHGFATLFLAEAYGMVARDEMRRKLELAVKVIINSQNKEGGWRYEPHPADADVSVTVCQIMALRAARNAGIYVPKDSVDRCTQYIRDCQNRDGGFRYQLNKNAPSLFPRSAAAVVALNSAGIYEGDEIDRALRYIERYIPQGQRPRQDSRYYYGHYYAAQVMWHAGGRYWIQWYPAIRDELLETQLGEGSWLDRAICNEYATAMATLILQMPNNYLPIFQR